MNLFYKILILLFMNGLTAGIAQAVLGREVSCVFPADMNLFSSVMASWVTGALLAIYLIDGLKKGKNSVAAMNYTAGLAPVANAFYCVLALFAARYYRPALSADFLTKLEPGTAWLLSAIVFVPVSALLTAAILADVDALQKAKAPNVNAVAAAAVLAGAVSGAAVYALFAVKQYPGLDIIYTLGIIVLAVAYLFFRGKDMQGKMMTLYIIGGLIIYFAFNVAGIKDKAGEAAARAVFRGYEVIVTKEFPTVNFAMVKKEGTYYLLENATVAYKIPEITYPVAVLHVKGPRVLVINGGLAGLVEELSKNRAVKEIVCVEADPYIGVFMEKMFGPSIKTDRKVEYINASSPAAIFEAVKGKGTFDTAVVVPRMKGTVAGKMYDTQKFRDEAGKFLNPGGEIIFTGI